MRLQCALYLIILKVKLSCIIILSDICVVYMLSFCHDSDLLQCAGL